MAGDEALAAGPSSPRRAPTDGGPPLPGAIARAYRAIRDALRDSVGGPFHDELIGAQRDMILQRTVVLIWISLFVMPTAILLFVYFAARPHLALAAWIVAAAVAVQLSLRLALARGAFRTHDHLAMLVQVGGVFGPTGSAIMALASGSDGSFLFAFFLIYFAFTSLFPADARWIVITSAAIVASYLGSTLVRADPARAANLIYFLELTVIGVVLNRVLCKLFFDERRARIELRGARDVLSAEMAVAQKIQTLLLPREPALPGYVLAGRMVPAALAAHAARGPGQVIEVVAERLAAHGGVQDDDYTLLVLQYVGPDDAAQVA